MFGLERTRPVELAALAVLEGQLAGNIGRTVLDDGNRTRSYRAACAVDSYTIVARVELIFFYDNWSFDI